MIVTRDALDLTPPPFSDGLCDWSRGVGGSGSPTYETGEQGRIARNDPDFGDCLELRKVDPVQRLRYLGEMPLRRAARVEVRVRVKALRGPLPVARIAASPGGFGGETLTGLAGAGPEVRLVAHEAVVELRASIGIAPLHGTDIVWSALALYAHVGLDLVGPCGGVVRVENFRVREMIPAARALPGFERFAR